jgi:cytidine deaminase
MTASDQDLVTAASAARENAYCRYSGYKVGAALVDDRGNMHVGCNVENSAFPEGTCAEANAIAAMIATGGKAIQSIVVIGGKDAPEDCTPCGGCRQKIAEFADNSARIMLVGADEELTTYSIDELLPNSFHFPD